MIATAVKIDRRFGKCPVAGCKTRRVIDGAPYVDGISIFYAGNNGAELAAAGLFCTDHSTHLKWTQLVGRTNPEKECNGICMAATGPSCDCACGGENHGANHI